MTYKLLIVDDEPANLRLLERSFSEEYYCLTASSGADAIDLLIQHDVAILITDQRMPQMTGIDLLKQTAELRPHMVRILLSGYTDAEALVEAVNCGLVHLYLTKPWNSSDLMIKVRRTLEQYEKNRRQHALQLANERLETRLKEMKAGFAHACAEALHGRDSYYAEQAARVAAKVAEIASRITCTAEYREDLLLAAALHNVGRLGTPDSLLEKESLNTEQQPSLQMYPERGARILGAVPELRDVADLIRFHQENFDGSGYPRGLLGEQIPLGCRVIRIALEYDLLTRPKPPAVALNHEQAIAHLRAHAGQNCDPTLIEALASSSAATEMPSGDSGESNFATLNSFETGDVIAP